MCYLNQQVTCILEIYIYIYIHTHTHIYIHTHTHTHTVYIYTHTHNFLLTLKAFQLTEFPGDVRDRTPRENSGSGGDHLSPLSL